MTATEVTETPTLQALLAEFWPPLTELRTAEPALLWDSLQRKGLAVPDSLASLTAAQQALGAAAAPAPVADAWVARELIGEAVDFTVAGHVPALVTAANVSDGTASAVEFGSIVTHIIVADPQSGHVAVHAAESAVETPGMSWPSWSRLTLGPVVFSTVLSPERVDQVLARARFSLAARSFAAAEATHQLAIAHARQRVQFGRHIGSYQAVQHRTVNCAIEVAMARALVDDAIRLDELADPTSALALEMAVAHALDRASWVQFEAHHTLAASGFFDLYPAPWLFRRVHADVARIPLLPRLAGTVADEIVDTGTSFPNASLGAEAEEFRAEIQRLFGQWQPERGSGRQAEISPGVVQGLRERGLITMNWPSEYGGDEASIEKRAVLSEEAGYRKLQDGTALGAASLIGNSIIAFGTDEQKARFLPLIADANLNFYLGYSEPDVGSDLASVQMSAVRHGDSWVLNGTKRWGQAQRADWAWLAARTDPDAEPRHAGISVFLFDLRGLEGFRIEEITSLAGETHAFSHYDNVRIPADALVGHVNEGWKIITAALAEERITMAGIASGTRGLLDQLLHELRQRDALPSRGTAARSALGRVATRLQAARVLTNRSLQAQASGQGRGAGALEAPLAKILGGEVTEEFSRLAVDLLGPAALLDTDAEGSVAGGNFDYSLRVCLIGTVGGGTGDIQRNIIARALGLPKA